MVARSYDIIAAARSEAARMSASIADAAVDARVSMSAGQFAKLATLLDNLCDVALDQTSGGIGDPRYWVPLEEFARLKRKHHERLVQPAALSDPLDLLLGNMINLSGVHGPAGVGVNNARAQ
jgi:hypothetical protein